jgi:hypothetical protein
VSQLSLADEKDDERRPRPPQETGSEPSASQVTADRKKRRPATPEVGQALRSAYQRTLDESIPPEMLDLLGKLG